MDVFDQAVHKDGTVPVQVYPSELLDEAELKGFEVTEARELSNVRS